MCTTWEDAPAHEEQVLTREHTHTLVYTSTGIADMDYGRILLSHEVRIDFLGSRINRSHVGVL